jgi:hypothetical protein
LNATHPKSDAVERLKADVLGELHLMTPADWQAYWPQVHWPKPNLIELAESKSSPLAIALKCLKPEVLAEASAHFCPFGWMLHAVGVNEWIEYCRAHCWPWMARVWLAAASQMRAEVRSLHKAHGWADTWKELRQNQSGPDNLPYADEYFFAQLRHADETRRAELLATPGLEDRLAKARQEKDEAFLRRFRRAKKHEGKRSGSALAERFVVRYWLELPRGLPGLCFFSDCALDNFLDLLGLKTGGDTSWATTQIRLRLGLIQSSVKRHLIEAVIKKAAKLHFTGDFVKTPWIFAGKIPWGKRVLWPR